MKRFSARKNRKHIKLPLQRLLFTVFILLIFIFVGFKQYQSSRFLVGDQRTNLVINSDPLMVISFARNLPDKQIILVFPKNTYLPVSYGYGNYRIESLWQLSILEKNPKIFTDSIADILGLPLHFYANKSEFTVPVTLKNNKDILDFIKKHFSFTFWLSSINRTNLNFIDKLIISKKIISMRGSDIYVYKLEDVPYLINNLILPDTTEVKILNQDVLDTFLAQKFENEQVRLEGLTVEIQNTTGISKVGQKFSRYLVTSGAKVIAITNSSEKIPKCQIMINSKNVSKSIVRFLIVNFSCQVVENNDNQNVDALIKLGEGFGARWPD